MKQRAVLLMGPTASGKTAVALELAKHLHIEIVNVDSALVYREMDIGTAKPSSDELATCPHHLINIISPEDSYSRSTLQKRSFTTDLGYQSTRASAGAGRRDDALLQGFA